MARTWRTARICQRAPWARTIATPPSAARARGCSAMSRTASTRSAEPAAPRGLIPRTGMGSSGRARSWGPVLLAVPSARRPGRTAGSPSAAPRSTRSASRKMTAGRPASRSACRAARICPTQTGSRGRARSSARGRRGRHLGSRISAPTLGRTAARSSAAPIRASSATRRARTGISARLLAPRARIRPSLGSRHGAATPLALALPRAALLRGERSHNGSRRSAPRLTRIARTPSAAWQPARSATRRMRTGRRACRAARPAATRRTTTRRGAASRSAPRARASP
mmetsp:Transcript_3348/g.8051  ORF Transcript_3348/g.8051 Transcript_3348/m.8051 type:complete len:283 (-) Transcript_3348:1068-1916(-)